MKNCVGLLQKALGGLVSERDKFFTVVEPSTESVFLFFWSWTTPEQVLVTKKGYDWYVENLEAINFVFKTMKSLYKETESQEFYIDKKSIKEFFRGEKNPILRGEEFHTYHKIAKAKAEGYLEDLIRSFKIVIRRSYSSN